ncbi:uncharacterized protein K02A2.6-like [Photinus pyralis]|nr:uncharacterized protein K02A2.6-like [Photinus pyralis]
MKIEAEKLKMDSNEKLRPMKLSGNLAENWKSWIQRFEIYSTATELDGKDQKIQCAQMLHHMGEDAINIFNSFTFADNEKNKIASLKEKFANYFVPKTNVTYERYKFFTSRQNEEPLEQFITNLKNQAQLCNLGEEALRNELIKTMLIIGIKDEAVREKLLQKEDLTLDKAIECCIVTESSRQQLRDMKQNTSSQSQGVNEIDSIRRTTRTMESNSRANKETKSRFDNKDQFKKVSNCTRCGKNHSINNCSAYGALCNNCKKPNHFANVCKYKSHRNRKINEIVDHDNYEQSLLINEISNNSKINNCTIELIVNNKVNVFVNFKVDTGANANIISLDQLKSIEFNEKSIQRSHEILLTFTGQKIPIVGKCYLHLRLKDKLIKNVEFHIHKGNGSIIGINACVELDIIKFHEEVKLKEIYAINKNCNSGYEKLINDNSNLFKGIGKVGRPYHIELNENAMPVVKPIRNVPFAIQEQFKKHLNELVNLKIIERVEGSSEWVNSYVIVRKNNGSLRICLDPKNLNESIKDSKYKLTSLDDIISNINGSTVFTLLDATSGFWNIPLDKESSKLCTFATPFGRYKFLRMPFGIKTASEVFQERFQEIFADNGVQVYIDDILVHGKDKQEHDERLKNVFRKAHEQNVKFNLSKCRFGVGEIKYLGYKFSSEGIMIDEEKIDAIKNMPQPKNKKDIQRFLGFITYVGRFIENLSEKTQPLREIIKQENLFEWGEPQNKAFVELKNLVIKEPILRYYNPKKPITLSVDASKSGLGAVLLQDNQPCAYASRAMTTTQQNYAQIEKELLAIVFGVNKFHQYVYGTKFIVETDHKPLIAIFKKPLNACPARLQRMLLSLQKYQIHLIYKPGKDLIIADTLSRANSSKTFDDNLDLEAQVCLIQKKLIITDNRVAQLVKEVSKDEELQSIKKYVVNGWPSISKIPSNIKPYHKLKAEITLGTNGLIYMSQRVIIPQSWRSKILDDIHTGHLGINKCISRAKSSVYWPNMNSHIETLVNKCEMCNRHANSNKREPMISHEIIKKPWQKVGIDLYEVSGKIYLIVVDYYSKFPEISNLQKNLTSSNIINKLKAIFARHGIPKIVVSDSAKQFTGIEFQNFSKQWNFLSIKSSPHHQQSNGQTERTIQTIKKLIKKSTENNEDIYLALLAFRNTPVYNSYTPSQILMSRYLRDNLLIIDSKLNPKLINNTKLNQKISNSQSYNKKQYDSKGVRPRQDFKIGTAVWYQLKPKSLWEKGKIVDKLSNTTYKVQTLDGKVLIRNRFYIRQCHTNNVENKDKYYSNFVY